MDILIKLKKIANTLDEMKLHSYAQTVDDVTNNVEQEVNPGADAEKDLAQKDQQIIERMLEILELPVGYTNINRIREEYRRKHFELWRMIRNILISQKNMVGSPEYKEMYEKGRVRVAQLRKELGDMHDSMVVLEERLAPVSGVVSPEEKEALKAEVLKNEEEMQDLDNELIEAENEYRRSIDDYSTEEEKQKALDRLNDLRSRVKKRTEEGMLFDGTLDIMELSRLKYKIDKMNKKAEKLGLPPMQIVYTMSEDEKDDKSRPMYYAKVRGQMPQLDGWKLSGVIDHMSTGNALRSIDGEDIPDKYMGALSSTCDECDVKHSRNQTMILKNISGEDKIIGKKRKKEIKPGETIQVGSACLSDFINKASISMWLEWAKMEKELFEGRGESGIEISLFVAMVADEILGNGYLKASTGERSTASQANGRYNAFIMPPQYMKKEEIDALKPSDKAIQLAQETMEWAKNLEATNTYQQTVKTLFNESFLRPKDFYRYMGFVASAVDAYMRSKSKLEKAQSGEGKVEVKATLLYGSVNNYGVQSYTFKDAEGVLVIVEGKLDESQLRKGNAYTVSGNVEKEGISRNSNKYKVLSNAEVVPLGEGEKVEGDKPGTPYVGEVKKNGTFDLRFANVKSSDYGRSFIFTDVKTGNRVYINDGDYVSKWLDAINDEGGYNNFIAGNVYRITAYVNKQQNNYTVMNRVKNIQEIK